MLLQTASEITENHEAPPADRGPDEWREVDRRLREYARHRASLDAAESFDLMRAEQIKLHFMHGFATMYEYLERVLGYGPHAARERFSSVFNGVTFFEFLRQIVRRYDGRKVFLIIDNGPCHWLDDEGKR